MFGLNWYHGALRKYTIYFGNLFTQIYIDRDDSEGETVQTMQVPLNYGPKEKFLARVEGNPELDRPIAIQLPRMAFEIINIAYDPTRKFASSGYMVNPSPTDPNSSNYQYNPVPYNIEFSLYVMVKNAEDGLRIVEQILPFFTPEWTASVNINPDLGQKYDIPVVLNSISQEDTYEGNFENRRALIWTLNFVMKAYLFGPTRIGSIIKQANVNVRIPPPNITIDDATTLNTTPTVEVSVTPGLTANGEPTSNASLSIDKNLINSTDNYGFIIDIQENF